MNGTSYAAWMAAAELADNDPPERSPMKTGALVSSCGRVEFDTDSGCVTACDLDRCDYSEEECPAVVDVEEWKLRYPGEWSLLPNEHDILDFGYWRRDGRYEPPCESWRKEREEMLREEEG